MTQKLTVAHLIATNFFGGPEKQIVTHAQMLDRARYRFVLISFIENGQPNQLLEYASRQGLDVVEIHSNNPFDPRVIAQLRSVLRQKKVNLLCSHGYKANILGRLASWTRNIPHVAISRGWTGENRKIRLYEVLDKLFLRLANHVVAVSEGQREKVLRLGVHPKLISVIHNAIDLTIIEKIKDCKCIRKELGIPSDGLIVTSAGRLSPEKNHLAMVEAARIVCAHRKDIYFAVFGEGFLRPKLEALVRQAGLEGRFFFPGFRKDIQAIFLETDIFMLPSFTEGLPNVALEAFAARKPIVATAVGGTPEVVQHDVSGFLTDPDNIEGLANFLLVLAACSARRKRMGDAGYAYVAEHFSFEEQTRKYEELYGKLSRDLKIKNDEDLI